MAVDMRTLEHRRQERRSMVSASRDGVHRRLGDDVLSGMLDSILHSVLTRCLHGVLAACRDQVICCKVSEE